MRSPYEPDCSNCGVKDKENCPDRQECIDNLINKRDEFKEDKNA